MLDGLGFTSLAQRADRALKIGQVSRNVSILNDLHQKNTWEDLSRRGALLDTSAYLLTERIRWARWLDVELGRSKG